MLTRFFSPPEVAQCFENGILREDLLNGETIAICSIADLLDICEAYKKGNLQVSHTELHTRAEAFTAGPVKEGVVYIVDLDQDNLSSALFERDDGPVVDLWSVAIERNISPKRSIRCLTLRITDDSTWWSEDVYQEMEDYHAVRDG